MRTSPAPERAAGQSHPSEVLDDDARARTIRRAIRAHDSELRDLGTFGRANRDGIADG